MPGTNRTTGTTVDHGPVVETAAELGGWTASIATFHADIDATPLLKGLPDDRCQCPHWGYVIAGTVSFGFPDRVEVFAAGDAFYVPAGHTNAVAEGTEAVMFSPTEELKATEEVLVRNLQAMQHA